MVNILIVYTSTFGSTNKIAQAMAKSLNYLNEVQCVIKNCESILTDDFIQSDAIILGTPVKMGAIDWQMKKMIDTIMGPLWMKDKLVGKVGGCFATGGGYGKAGAGAELVLASMANVLLEMGIIYIPLPKNTTGYKLGGIQWGAYGQSADENMQFTELNGEQLISCQIHAQNIARITKVINKQKVFNNQLENEHR